MGDGGWEGGVGLGWGVGLTCCLASEQPVFDSPHFPHPQQRLQLVPQMDVVPALDPNHALLLTPHVTSGVGERGAAIPHLSW